LTFRRADHVLVAVTDWPIAMKTPVSGILAVFGGMIAASLLGIFVIPGLYVLFQSLREWVKKVAAANTETPPLDESALVAHAGAEAGSGQQSPTPR